jgi:hypothetical protein
VPDIRTRNTPHKAFAEIGLVGDAICEQQDGACPIVTPQEGDKDVILAFWSGSNDGSPRAGYLPEVPYDGINPPLALLLIYLSRP